MTFIARISRKCLMEDM